MKVRFWISDKKDISGKEAPRVVIEGKDRDNILNTLKEMIDDISLIKKEEVIYEK